MKIRAFKLVSGEDVLSEVQGETETHYVLENAVGIAVVRGANGQPNVGFTPFPLHAVQTPGATITIHKSHIVYHYIPAKDFITNYESLFGSGIIVPVPKKLIIG